MKRMLRLLAIPFIALSLTLTACPFYFGDNGSWKDEWGTPELFLSNAKGHKYMHMYEENDKYPDEDDAIRNLIIDSAPFQSVNKRNPTADRYFTYEGYWQAATSGPNYCNMSIWDDGLIRIDHKYSLGPHTYLYFIMDVSKATIINDTVFGKLTRIKQIRKEDEAQARVDGSIESFFSAMEKEAKVLVKLGEGKAFYDNGEILATMKEATYTPTSNLTNIDIKFSYNRDKTWYFELWGVTNARLEYHYTNHLNEEKGVVLIYLLGSLKGQAIIDKALEISKRS